jgi:hypothetical protein
VPIQPIQHVRLPHHLRVAIRRDERAVQRGQVARAPVRVDAFR